MEVGADDDALLAELAAVIEGESAEAPSPGHPEGSMFAKLKGEAEAAAIAAAGAPEPPPPRSCGVGEMARRSDIVHVRVPQAEYDAMRVRPAARRCGSRLEALRAGRAGWS